MNRNQGDERSCEKHTNEERKTQHETGFRFSIGIKIDPEDTDEKYNINTINNH